MTLRLRVAGIVDKELEFEFEIHGVKVQLDSRLFFETMNCHFDRGFRR